MEGLEFALQNLKDIRTPEPVSWWPLAPGWWMLAAISAVILFALARFLLQRRRRIKVLAKRELDELWRDYLISKDKQSFLQDVSILLRRTAICVDSRDKVAALTGEAWLQYLDSGMSAPEFSDGSGRVLINGPYRKAELDFEPQSLYLLVNRWVNRVPC